MEPPTGRRKLAAILMADVVEYGRHMGEDEAATIRTLKAHRAVFTGHIQQRYGRVVDAKGDAIMAEFASVVDAVAAAVEVQRQIATDNEPLPDPRKMSFRIGINVGDVVQEADSLYGDGVNIAARLETLADPGGICISRAAHDHVVGKLPVEFEYMGERKVKIQTVRCYRVAIPGVSRPADTGGATPEPLPLEGSGNLPHSVTSFFGRSEEIGSIGRTLERSRIVTLAGVGGVGKTRLSLEVARSVAARYPDGTWFCELAPVVDPEAVPHTLAAAIGIDQRPGMSMAESIVDAIKSRRMLLLIDNCEHVLEASAKLVTAIATTCPGVTLFSTSRESLGVDGEAIESVPPLAFPESQDGGEEDDLESFAAIELFVDRARSARPGFTLSADHRQPVADICRRLDGVPLALELAAARMRSMGPSDIASRLDERFRLLTAGRRTAVPRHQTLRGTIDWSYDLLTEPEQRLFNRLSVFAGGFSMEAAEQVCSEGAIDQLDVVDLVASLVDKSMVMANDTSLGSRYRILETLRQYGDEHAAEAGEADWLARRHGEYFVDLAEQAEEGVRGPDEAHWVQVFNAELGNLRAAHLWTIEAKETDLAMRLAATTPIYGILRLRFELLSWALPAIELPGATDHSLYPYVCGTASFGLWAQGRFKEAKAYGELAIKGEAELGVTPTWLPRQALMCVALNEGEMERANALTDEQLELTKAAGDKVRFAHVLLCKAVWLYEFEEESQLRIAETAAKIAKEGENPSMIAATGWGLAFALEETDPPRAMRVIRESIDLCRSIEYRWVLANALTLECSLQVQFGDARDALPPMDEAIDLWHRAGDRASQWKTVRSGIAALSQLGNFESAATIHGASADKSLMGELPTGLAKKLADELGRIEGEMGGDAFKAAVARGEAMSDDEIIAFTRSEIARILAGKVRT